MRIGIDIMGGDYAPDCAIKGAINALHHLDKDDVLIFFGKKDILLQQLDHKYLTSGRIEIIDSSEVIEMNDHPAKAFTQKADSSISVGFRYLAKRDIDGFASAGNTGAMLVGSMYAVKQIPGILRPAISTILPSLKGNDAIMLDIGINPDCKPENIFQYAVLGSIYSSSVFGVDKPRVALLNIGEEREKGSLLTKASYELLENSDKINFVGNIEGFDLLTSDKADVVVSDGFTGNVVLKLAESFYKIFRKREIHDTYLDRFNFELYGGTPILGVDAPVIVGHGASKENAFKAMILNTKKVIEANIHKKITKAFENDKN